MRSFFAAMRSCGSRIITVSRSLTVGSAAPKLDARDQDDNIINLTSIFEDGLTLVYFYPKADTPGCTKQACNLRDAFEEVTAAGIKVIGVSIDSPSKQKGFALKYQLPFTLIADENMEVTKAFGVPVRFGAFSARQSFLIHQGKVVWMDRRATPKQQAQDVLVAARELEEAW